MSSTPSPMADLDLEALRVQLRAEQPLDVLRKAHDQFGDRLAIAVSFGAEDMVLVELVRQLVAEGREQIRLFTLDTGRLHEETLQLLDRVRLSLKLKVEVFAPRTAQVEALVNDKGPFSFFDSSENRRECCAVRKVEPLGRALSTIDAWITGLRREQSPTRQDLSLVEIDSGHVAALGRSLVKLNPLLEWSEAEVWRFLSANNVPTHKLHEQGYPSLGCAPCTRAVAGWTRGEPSSVDLRSGRWWWESPEHKECGLHPAGVQSLPVLTDDVGDTPPDASAPNASVPDAKRAVPQRVVLKEKTHAA